MRPAVGCAACAATLARLTATQRKPAEQQQTPAEGRCRRLPAGNAWLGRRKVGIDLGFLGGKSKQEVFRCRGGFLDRGAPSQHSAITTPSRLQHLRKQSPQQTYPPKAQLWRGRASGYLRDPTVVSRLADGGESDRKMGDRKMDTCFHFPVPHVPVPDFSNARKITCSRVWLIQRTSANKIPSRPKPPKPNFGAAERVARRRAPRQRLLTEPNRQSESSGSSLFWVAVKRANAGRVRYLPPNL